ncbi:alcohol dehydrogenase class IV [Neisseria sp. HSC-16F19]|nr:iron-containing alcohol dehydrogenase [Neisseria sp. HSC-16F19]MCP2041207.1 alcohol dehydrogenase class IV [Neisseria sp. HSC-16F19]
MSLTANWNYPTAIRFGAGRIKELVSVCQELNIHKPLLVTDAGLATLPVFAQVKALLSEGLPGTGVFDQVRPNPGGSDVEKGVALFRQGGHDGVVSIGGGSALDVGKAIALMAGQTLPLWDFEDVGDNWTRVNVAGVAPSVAIPTTSGTGSEVGRASLIIDEENHRKVIIFHPSMLPKIVLADPELTAGLPPKLTAATGVDAFVHNLEAYCSPFYHPMAQGVALEGMKLVHEYLQQAYDDGSNIEARSQMLAASIMGATAFQKGLGGVHALSHPIGAVFDTHHGLANAIMLPYVLVRNKAAIADKLAAAARYLNLPDCSFEGFLQWVLDLRQSLGIPHTLADIGIDESQAQLIAEGAKKDPSDGGNPVELSVDDYREIFIAAVKGIL